jgi:imidazolonepropionase-like amidohydrolase
MNALYRLCLPFLLWTFFAGNSLAQVSHPQAAPSDNRPECFALTNATIFTDYKTQIKEATLVVRKGVVEACGTQVAVPSDAVVIDCAGKTIYPSFIDLYGTDYGLPEVKAAPRNFRSAPQYQTSTKGAYAWNEALKPEFDAAAQFSNNEKEAANYRKAGFGTVLTHRADGISRGTGALVTLGTQPEQKGLLKTQASHHLSFRKGSSAQNYPSSLMGCIALIRQTYLDGQWYQQEGNKQETNLSLEAWNRVQGLPQIFEAADKLDVLRIHRIATEFGKSYIVKTSGDEYQRINEIKATGQALIVSLDFPNAYPVADPYEALDVSIQEMKHWELAPGNAGRLEAAGIPFALTADGLRDKSKFWAAVMSAVEAGLSQEEALKALTYQPAQLLGVYKIVGSLEPGKKANFLVCSGDLFDSKSKLLENWVLGEKHNISSLKNDGEDLRGEYKLTVDNVDYNLSVKGSAEALKGSVLRQDSSKANASIEYANGLIQLRFPPDSTSKEMAALSGTMNQNQWAGKGTMPNGRWVDWTAQKTGEAKGDRKKKDKDEEEDETASSEITYPFLAFGWTDQPKAEELLIKNATVWTNEKDGILSNTDVYISGGEIKKIGKNLKVPASVPVLDATGRHLTAGIIDEHSHIAVARSVNEGTQESSAEVRIGDALNSEDINIYRQLAGGVTSSHLLHGSANPIGGQTQLIKLRWGYAPEQLKFENWDGQIKFALGENVKQSNWGDNNRSRYPQTRMGVEQVYVDYFTRAQEYAQLKKSGKPFRKDLELEALQEILEKRRFITCHSYVQSEITMLMRVAEQFNFKVNTFTHILEGYKVADKMREHGAGGSTFSDWWDYKFEVYQAIPYNAAMMHRQGVTVAINSDDAEMARRLNQEAAKTVQYGGLSEEEAWKTVTLNPAKLLHVDDRVGSIKAGKHADLVLWSDNPLSIYSHAMSTWVDGIRFYDLEKDVKMRKQLTKERARLIQKMGAEKNDKGPRSRPAGPRENYHCDSEEDEG